MKTFCNLSLAALLAAWSLGVDGRTIYVEKWGNDSGMGLCGGRFSPCESISQAIGQAAKNDRIRVGPGIYEENLIINIEGLKLESTAGRHATAIWAANNALPAVIVNQPRVSFGRPGRGFALHRSTQDTMFSDPAGLFAFNADRLKLEGNLAFGNRVGFILSGDRIQVRHNIVEDNAHEGIICDGCPRANFSHNRISGNDRALAIMDSAGIRFDRNYLAGNALSLSVDDLSVNAGIRDNVMFNNFAESTRISTGDGVLIRGNIASILRDGFTQDNGISARQPASSATDNAKALKVEHNLTLGFDGIGLSIRDFAKVIIRNNHGLQNTFSGLLLEPDPNLQNATIRNNAGYANTSSCSIQNISAVVMQVFNQYIGTGTPCGPLDYQGGIPPRPASLNVNRARRL